MDDFERKNRNIADTKLWELFVRKAEEAELGRDFVSAVGEVCAIGLNLSKYIVRFFPTFTLHDETHSANVCRWMWVLLGEKRAQLTAHEAALLLMAACCHDIGMAVSPEQEKQMRLRTYPGWDNYFRQNLKDDEEYEETKVISDRMLRNFVRMHHHERIGENLRQSDWPGILNRKGINHETFLKLCRSHGTELSRLELRSEPKFDLLLCAVLLRLADLLNYDTSRAPAVLFRHMGLDRPANAEEKCSAVEYGNNQAGTFDETIVNDVISYYAEYDNPQQEQNIQEYLDWVAQELKHCAEELAQTGSDWRSLRLPYRINTDGVVRNGYAAGKFCMTMDQDKVIDLLTGENLYSDAGVFVRELLQNSIDAVLMRAKQDTNFSSEDGLIQIDTWMDEEANTWFRIRDNGTGMNEHIIQNHFLKVGNSFYTSEEFQYANRHAPKGSYTAISRFGIGILSCFMGDKEHTQLKVSTKRFDEGAQCGIRLDVTGLHGYYFLCKEKEHSEGENWFPKMPSQNKEDRGYSTEPGTTICVNANLLRMGELRSFQEILDKYVQFPEIRVTYNGPEGYKEYPTQQELMEAVYALNPDGVVREYVHEIPEKAFVKLRETFPFHTWVEKPTITLQYTPINWLSDSEKMTGVRIRAWGNQAIVSVGEIDDVACRNTFTDTGVEIRVLKIGEQAIELHARLISRGVPVYLALDMIQLECVCADIPLKDKPSFLSDKEQRLWSMAFGALQGTSAKSEFTAYNGVLAQVSPAESPDCCDVVLLREDFQPQVNMARDRIAELPCEAICCHAVAGSPVRVEYERLVTERELWAVLDNHPRWEQMLREKASERGELIFGYMRYLGMAYWKRICRVSSKKKKLYADSVNPPDEDTADFPAAMFVWMEEPLLASKTDISHEWTYNRSHPFSQWLIKNRVSLEKQAPVIYDKLICTMMLEHDEDKICNIINNILNTLRLFPGNSFCVTDDLFLCKTDFGSYRNPYV